MIDRALASLRALLGLAIAAPLLACSSDASRGGVAAPALVAPDRPRTRRPPAPAEWYWEGVDADLHEPEPRPLDLPIPEVAVARPEGASRLWDELGEPVRDRLRRDGLVVTAPLGDRVAARMRVGAFYMDARERRLPLLLTLDALHATAVLGIGRAVAAVEANELAPALEAFVAKITSRLDATSRVAEQELVGPHRIARGVLAVAAALLSNAPPPPDLAAVVAQEIVRVDAHVGVETSPLLGVPIDYSRFVVPSGAASPRAFRAATWLGAAPLLLAGRTELRGGSADLTVARRHARAAMLLSRLVDRDVDPEVSDAYARVARLVTFVWGAPDDFSLVELGDLAEALKVDLAKPSAVASVVAVDHVRHRAALVRPPRVYDGSGGLSAGGRPPMTVRVLGGHAPPDALALATLLSGELARARPLPTALDVAAWLGAPGIRTTLRESGLDTAPLYEDALGRALATRPGEDDAARHGSIEGSLLDVLLAWAEAKEAGARSVATERARTESLLASWTLAHHLGRPFARPAPRVPSRRELEVTGAPLPVFVEPKPNAIAHLYAAVRQANKGLGALGALDPKSPQRTALAEIEDILALCLRAASRAHDDEPTPEADLTALAAVPARIAALEGDLPDADLAVLTDVATDPRGRRVLVAAVAGVEPALVLVRDVARDPPGVVLAVGAHLVFTERVEPQAARTPDATWSARIRSAPYDAASGTKPAQATVPGDERALAWLASFRVPRAARPKP